MQKREMLKTGRPVGSKSFDPDSARAFGVAIREQRIFLKMSQEELALKAQVERSHMGKIERGEHMPNLTMILRLAKAMSIRPGLLIDRTVDMLSSTQLTVESSSPTLLEY